MRKVLMMLWQKLQQHWRRYLEMALYLLAAILLPGFILLVCALLWPL